jgi:hypothetical protein
MVCLLAGTRFTKSLVLFGGWQAACRLDCYKIQLVSSPSTPPHPGDLQVTRSEDSFCRNRPQAMLQISSMSVSQLAVLTLTGTVGCAMEVGRTLVWSPSTNN